MVEETETKGQGLFCKIRRAVIDIKIWLIRSQSWISVANTAMLGFLFLSTLQEIGVIHVDDVKQFTILIICGTLLCMVIWGYLDEKLGFFKEEADRGWAQNRNPHIDRIHASLERIENRLEELEKKVSKNE